MFFGILYFLVALVNLKPTQIKSENVLFEKFSYFNTQRWLFFTRDVTKDYLFLYDGNFNQIDVKLSSKRNGFGFKKTAQVIDRDLLKLSKSISVQQWQDASYTIGSKPIVYNKDTIVVENKPYTLDKGIYILEKRPVTPYEWKNNKTLLIQSKYIVFKIE